MSHLDKRELGTYHYSFAVAHRIALPGEDSALVLLALAMAVHAAGHLLRVL